jgi:hypothetical protein
MWVWLVAGGLGVIGLVWWIRMIRRGVRQAAIRKQSWVREDLGLQSHDSQLDGDLRRLINRLVWSYSREYVDRVKRRVMENHGIRETEWNNRWFELKRFFLMTALMKQVPMYSREVDQVWHEMLMFTRAYEQFSKRFLGEYLHHEPHDAAGAAAGRTMRGWFDLIYCWLFQPTPYSILTWGAFFRQPVPTKILRDFEGEVSEEVLERYFRWSAGDVVVRRIVFRLAEQIHEGIRFVRSFVEERGRDEDALIIRLFDQVEDPVSRLMYGVLFYSLYDAPRFDVSRILKWEEIRRTRSSKSSAKKAAAAGGTTSSCTTFFGCSSSGSEDGGNHCGDGGSHCGSGSCGGGCGGGGCSSS